MHRPALLGICLLTAVSAWNASLLNACGQPSRQREFSPQRLQQLLKRFPEADANGDGVLTTAEARSYRERTRPDATAPSRGKAAQGPQPTHAGISYGPHERNVLDLYLAESPRPTPLIVYIHGGGFVAGDKKSVQPAMIAAAHARGVSVAALNYRFVNGRDVVFPAPQHDCARALQFLRSQAEAWNLDPARVACYGGSAGAWISMWLGFHEDLAQPESDDPIARQSTRVLAIGTIGGQGTYDPVKIKQLVGGRAWEHPSLVKVYGLQSPEQALEPSPEMQALYDEASAITHLTADDPPLYMIYSEPDIVPPADSRPGQFIHHPNFGKQLKARMDELGVANTYVHTSEAAGRDVMREMFEFLAARFEAGE